MTGDPIERLRQADPVEDGGSAPAFEDVMARIRRDQTGAAPGRRALRRRWPHVVSPTVRIAAAVGGVAATVGVVAVVVIAAGAHHPGRRADPSLMGAARRARVPSPVSLLPSHGGMRGLLFAVTVAGSGSTLRVDFVQCTNCGHSAPGDELNSDWSAMSTDGAHHWRTRRPRVSLLSFGLALPEGQNVWQSGFAPQAGDASFFVSHDSGRTYSAVRAPSHSGYEAITLGDGEVWTLGVRCVHYQCRSTALHGPAAGDSLSQTPAQPPGMPTHRAPIGLLVAGYGDRAYVSEGAQRRLYVTDDNGQSWSQTTYPCPATTVIRNLTPTGDGAVWVACQARLETRHGKSSRTEQNSPVTVRRSEDGGRHWQTPDPAFHHAIALVAVSAQVAWAENLSGALQRTTNSGRSWQTVLRGAGPDPAVDVESSTTATVVATATTGTRAAHTRRTELVAYRTVDGGSHWTHTLIHLPTG